MSRWLNAGASGLLYVYRPSTILRNTRSQREQGRVTILDRSSFGTDEKRSEMNPSFQPEAQNLRLSLHRLVYNLHMSPPSYQHVEGEDEARDTLQKGSWRSTSVYDGFHHWSSVCPLTRFHRAKFYDSLAFLRISDLSSTFVTSTFPFSFTLVPSTDFTSRITRRRIQSHLC